MMKQFHGLQIKNPLRKALLSFKPFYKGQTKVLEEESTLFKITELIRGRAKVPNQGDLKPKPFAYPLYILPHCMAKLWIRELLAL